MLSLWLRSLTVEAATAGADPERLQIDITREKPIDDNAFMVELTTIANNSFNIHKIGTRLVFKAEDNPRTRLLTYARNDKQFGDGRDLKQLAKELRHIIGGDETTSPLFRTIVLPRDWAANPWGELDDPDRPAGWGGKVPLIVLPECPENINATLGAWLKEHMVSQRNVARFLLPRKASLNIYFDADLLIAARAVCLAQEWAISDAKYRGLVGDFRDELKKKLGEEALKPAFAVAEAEAAKKKALEKKSSRSAARNEPEPRGSANDAAPLPPPESDGSLPPPASLMPDTTTAPPPSSAGLGDSATLQPPGPPDSSPSADASASPAP